mmetsp:Transcript_129874/g.416757  ORF Transcript_129874/g.416757 Transcript_129874/m.416757 type:complete len:247 (+) Transcript_129874:1467-2207(+)
MPATCPPAASLSCGTITENGFAENGTNSGASAAKVLPFDTAHAEPVSLSLAVAATWCAGASCSPELSASESPALGTGGSCSGSWLPWLHWSLLPAPPSLIALLGLLPCASAENWVASSASFKSLLFNACSCCLALRLELLLLAFSRSLNSCSLYATTSRSSTSSPAAFGGTARARSSSCASPASTTSSSSSTSSSCSPSAMVSCSKPVAPLPLPFFFLGFFAAAFASALALALASTFSSSSSQDMS